MSPYRHIFPCVLACLACVAVPADAAGITSGVSSIRIQATDGSRCSISAADLTNALKGKSIACNQQMGHVVRLQPHMTPQHPKHVVKAVYDYTAWYSRPLDRSSQYYYGQRGD